MHFTISTFEYAMVYISLNKMKTNDIIGENILKI